MNTIAQWLTEDGNIVVPKTLDTQVFDENGKSLNRRLKTAKDEQIIQLPKVNPTLIVSDLNYSTEEQLTGKRWIDGKPIYQKSYNITNTVVLTTEWHQIIQISDNIETLVSSEIYDTAYVLDMYLIRYKDGYLQGFAPINTLGVNAGSYITIQYTKTTDTASSPVAPPKVEAMHVYSTEEKVVGTWIDGQKIYEKTWKIDNTTATSNWDVTNADFENIAFVVEATLYDTDSETPRSVPVKTRKLSSTSIRFYTGDSWLSIDAYTIQYVKTTATTT